MFTHYTTTAPMQGLAGETGADDVTVPDVPTMPQAPTAPVTAPAPRQAGATQTVRICGSTVPALLMVTLAALGLCWWEASK